MKYALRRPWFMLVILTLTSTMYPQDVHGEDTPGAYQTVPDPANVNETEHTPELVIENSTSTMDNADVNTAILTPELITEEQTSLNDPPETVDEETRNITDYSADEATQIGTEDTGSIIDHSNINETIKVQELVNEETIDITDPVGPDETTHTSLFTIGDTVNTIDPPNINETANKSDIQNSNKTDDLVDLSNETNMDIADSLDVKEINQTPDFVDQDTSTVLYSVNDTNHTPDLEGEETKDIIDLIDNNIDDTRELIEVDTANMDHRPTAPTANYSLQLVDENRTNISDANEADRAAQWSIEDSDEGTDVPIVPETDYTPKFIIQDKYTDTPLLPKMIKENAWDIVDSSKSDLFETVHPGGSVSDKSFAETNYRDEMHLKYGDGEEIERSNVELDNKITNEKVYKYGFVRDSVYPIVGKEYNFDNPATIRISATQQSDDDLPRSYDRTNYNHNNEPGISSDNTAQYGEANVYNNYGLSDHIAENTHQNPPYSVHSRITEGNEEHKAAFDDFASVQIGFYPGFFTGKKRPERQSHHTKAPESDQGIVSSKLRSFMDYFGLYVKRVKLYLAPR